MEELNIGENIHVLLEEEPANPPATATAARVGRRSTPPFYRGERKNKMVVIFDEDAPRVGVKTPEAVANSLDLINPKPEEHDALTTTLTATTDTIRDYLVMELAPVNLALPQAVEEAKQVLRSLTGADDLDISDVEEPLRRFLDSASKIRLVDLVMKVMKLQEADRDILLDLHVRPRHVQQKANQSGASDQLSQVLGALKQLSKVVTAERESPFGITK